MSVNKVEDDDSVCDNATVSSMSSSSAASASANGELPTNNSIKIIDEAVNDPDNVKLSLMVQFPRRPLSAYNLFVHLERQRILQESDDSQPSEDSPVPKYTVEEVSQYLLRQRLLRPLHETKHKRRHVKTHGKIGFAELARTTANRWKEMDEAERNVFRTCFAAENERYQIEVEEWKRLHPGVEIPDDRKNKRKRSSIDQQGHHEQTKTKPGNEGDKAKKLKTKATASSRRKSVDDQIDRLASIDSHQEAASSLVVDQSTKRSHASDTLHSLPTDHVNNNNDNNAAVARAMPNRQNTVGNDNFVENGSKNASVSTTQLEPTSTEESPSKSPIHEVVLNLQMQLQRQSEILELLIKQQARQHELQQVFRFHHHQQLLKTGVPGPSNLTMAESTRTTVSGGIQTGHIQGALSEVVVVKTNYGATSHSESRGTFFAEISPLTTDRAVAPNHSYEGGGSITANSKYDNTGGYNDDANTPVGSLLRSENSVDEDDVISSLSGDAKLGYNPRFSGSPMAREIRTNRIGHNRGAPSRSPVCRFFTRRDATNTVTPPMGSSGMFRPGNQRCVVKQMATSFQTPNRRLPGAVPHQMWQSPASMEYTLTKSLSSSSSSSSSPSPPEPPSRDTVEQHQQMLANAKRLQQLYQRRNGNSNPSNKKPNDRTNEQN